jgi:hypothetical protein
MAKRMHSFSGDWRLIDTAPMDQDVTLLVTDGRGEPYCIPYPCKLTASGWLNSGKGLSHRPARQQNAPVGREPAPSSPALAADHPSLEGGILGCPMTLGNMRANGVRSLDVSCWQCHHRAILSADPWPDHVPVPTFGPRMVCTRCGIIGADARPNWQEQPPRETLTGVQWR